MTLTKRDSHDLLSNHTIVHSRDELPSSLTKRSPKIALLSTPENGLTVVSWCSNCRAYTGLDGIYPLGVCHTSSEHASIVRESNRKKPSPKLGPLATKAKAYNIIYQKRSDKIREMRMKSRSKVKFVGVEWKERFGIKSVINRGKFFRPNRTNPHGE